MADKLAPKASSAALPKRDLGKGPGARLRTLKGNALLQNGQASSETRTWR